MRFVTTLALGLVAACGRIGFDPGGGPGDAGTPGDVAPTCVADIAVGEEHACARLGGGALWCWGNGESGRLGNGTMSQVATAPAQVLAGPYAQVSLARAHSCALRVDGSVDCWGEGNNGQLGIGANAAVDAPVRVPGVVADRIQIAGSHTCVRAGAAGSCWGDGDGGQLADGTKPDLRDVPGPISTPAVTELWTGEDGTCVLVSGRLRCWGINGAGQLGVPPASTTDVCNDHDDVLLPCSLGGVEVAGAPAIASLSLGRRHSCAIDPARAVWCWGDNTSGQLGDGTLISRAVPQPVPGLTGVREIATGQAQTCAMLDDGTVQCWGTNAQGELGDGTRTSRPTPAPVPGLPPVRQIAMASDGEVVCALADDGVWCWGHNPWDVAGDSGGSDVLLPKRVLGACPTPMNPDPS